MEQAQYLMWGKRKHSFNPHIPATPMNPLYNDSWEEQAFAEDAAGPLGGCIWPPRSYSCSFCRREFRSAQALGGHMNVHRRDRARLKQSPSSCNETQHPNHQNLHNPIQNSFTSLGFQHPSQVCTLVYNPNPNSSDPGVMVSSASPSRVSASSTQENCSAKSFINPHSSPIVQEHQKRSPISASPSWSNLVADKYYCVSDLKTEEEKNSRFVDSGYRAKGDYVTTDLSVSLNLVVRRTHPTVSSGKDETTDNCKRRRNEPSSLPFLLKPRSVDRQHVQSKVLEVSPNSIEDLDLELRLGDRPLVK